ARCRDPAALEFRKEVGHCGTPRFLRAARIVPRGALRRAARRRASSENQSWTRPSHTLMIATQKLPLPREVGPERRAAAFRKASPARHKYRTQSWSRRTRAKAPRLGFVEFR